MKSACVRLASLSLLALTVTACGGGGDAGSRPSAFGGPIDPAAVGAYVGGITSSPDPDDHYFLTLLLEDGSFWTTYGSEPIGDHQITGFMQGTMAAISKGSYSSMDVKDFGRTPVLSGTMSGTYSAGLSITGTVQYGGGVATIFSGKPFPHFAYDSPAQLSDISGGWAMSMVVGTSKIAVNINVSNTGVIGGTSVSGCAFSGRILPRASGKHVFDITLTFGAAPCPLARQTVKGVAIDYVMVEGRELIALMVDSDRTIGVRASGIQ